MSDEKVTVGDVLAKFDINYSLTWNTSRLFLLRPLDLQRNVLKELGFIESYLKDADNTTSSVENPIFLLFKPEQFEKLESFIREQYDRKDEVLMEDYDYEGGYTVLLYSFPEKWKKDYKLFTYGKYSKLSKEFTELFAEKNKVQGVQIHEMQWMIITKDENWIVAMNDILGTELTAEDELWKAVDLEKETLKINEIREKQT